METAASHSPQETEAVCEVSVLMPCLNEAETLGTCINKAKASLKSLGVNGEVIVADNGSTDGSQEIARSLGALVVNVERTGYGNALMRGIATARGKYVIMGDSDDSYDFITGKRKRGICSHEHRNRGKFCIRCGGWRGNPALSVDLVEPTSAPSGCFLDNRR